MPDEKKAAKPAVDAVKPTTEAAKPTTETAKLTGEQEKNVENPAAQQATITTDDSGTTPTYANFCRVMSTAEEIILDLGLNPQPIPMSDITVKIDQRVVMSPYTAKRLINALGLALNRHEQTFGVLETDIRKRVRGNPKNN